ncbi:hypothetical protein LOC51_20035 [Rubrivivax sp. JA1024]|uniref:hypothetical protein n=1 Tax=Rhodopseudomonas sp. G2_2311 TaxID=3114287 RepID=UPI001E4BB4B5|nr:hypothetical protein [Rubrivivax sp. JA1024]
MSTDPMWCRNHADDAAMMIDGLKAEIIALREALEEVVDTMAPTLKSQLRLTQQANSARLRAKSVLEITG